MHTQYEIMFDPPPPPPARHLKNVLKLNYFPGITTSLQTDTNRDFDCT